MRLAFFEVYGDPVRDGQVTVTREGTADLLVSPDTFLNDDKQNATTCMIRDRAYRLAGNNEKSTVFEGVIYPGTRQQRLVRFARMHAAEAAQTSDRIVLLSGTLNRGEAIFDIQRYEETNITDSDSMICYTPGARILTAFGDIPVEKLRTGDLIHTADNGLQPVRWIGQRQISKTRLRIAPHLRPVKISRDAFGPGLPAADIRVSPSHRFLIEDWKSSLLFGQDQVLAPARGLINSRTVVVDQEISESMYIHLLFDEHQVVFVEGVASESFYPCPHSLMSLDGDARDAVFSVFPNLENHPLSYPDAARFALRVNEAKLLRAA